MSTHNQKREASWVCEEGGHGQKQGYHEPKRHVGAGGAQSRHCPTQEIEKAAGKK